MKLSSLERKYSKGLSGLRALLWGFQRECKQAGKCLILPFTQASELLRELCIKNMVWKYCRSISTEWKQQVWGVQAASVEL